MFSLTFGIDAFAEPIKITKSSFYDGIIYDGKWSFEYEWKQTSWNMVSDGESELNIRSAHYDEFIYILLDYVTTDNTSHEYDSAFFCIDADNDKTQGVTGDEFCFKLSMNDDEPETFVLELSEDVPTLKKLENHPDLIGVSSLSDENDRYSKIPHPTYELRIPIDLFGRSNNYGVFIGINDEYRNKVMTWPNNIQFENDIPSPKIWGDMISPDNTLPEFPFPVLVVTVVLSMIIILGRYTPLSKKI